MWVLLGWLSGCHCSRGSITLSLCDLQKQLKLKVQKSRYARPPTHASAIWPLKGCGPYTSLGKEHHFAEDFLEALENPQTLNHRPFSSLY